MQGGASALRSCCRACSRGTVQMPAAGCSCPQCSSLLAAMHSPGCTARPGPTPLAAVRPVAALQLSGRQLPMSCQLCACIASLCCTVTSQAAPALAPSAAPGLHSQLLCHRTVSLVFCLVFRLQMDRPTPQQGSAHPCSSKQPPVRRQSTLAQGCTCQCSPLRACLPQSLLLQG